MSKFKLMAPLMTATLVLAACGPGDDGNGGEDLAEGDGEIVVTSLWGGAEETAFQAVLDAFEAETGITAEYEANRTDYPTVLRTRIQGDNPPDVAIIPGIGTLRSLAREGSLVSLDDLGISRSDIEDNYAPGILDVGVVDDELFGVMVKLNSKSTIWYSPERFTEMGVEPATTWDELIQLTEDIKAAGGTPWAVGAGADSEWTLTDWFENIYLKMHGAEAYDTLFSPDGDWTDQTVIDTANTMLEIVNEDNIAGGVSAALQTHFVDAIGLVFGTSPSAELMYLGGFTGGIATGPDVNPDLAGQEGEAIDWFEFPTIDGSGEGLVTYGGDVMAALVADTDVRDFMEFLTTVEAGQTWAEGGTIISPIVEVDTSVYPTILIQNEAEQVTSAEAVRFDGSDLLPSGPNLGNQLQAVLRGDDPATVFEAFAAEVENAWAQE